ncbi:hypothetical protein RvY_08486 [Ramazzottius varieornatus]|uniref:SH3 domain-containing protein n=1 Tax=Ramazzottius varieornatus TaxID=947166 RepID=A0A1D1V631_RAMVA|nr:hypothetical protein RvY_08486 [Ramazzottius varieornatus]
MTKDVTKIKSSAKIVIRKPQSPAILKHGIQLEKLQAKHTLESAVIENIRSVLRQKAQLEKDCATAVHKLLNQHYLRKELVSYTELFQNGQNELQISSETAKLTLAQVWKETLVELQRQQVLKLESCEAVINLTNEESKAVKVARAAQVKRGIDVMTDIQGEISSVVDMVTRSKKAYVDSERTVIDMQQKIQKLEEKSRKSSKPPKIPEKIVETYRNELPRATAARNEYILSVVGANAHLSRYYAFDLPYIINLVNGLSYDATTALLSAVFNAEYRIVPEINNSLQRILQKSQQMNDDVDIQSFVAAQPCFHEAITYSYEPVPGDPVTHITAEDDANIAMNRCARKWALRFVEGEAAQKKLFQQMEALTSQAAENSLETEEGRQAMDVKLFALNESLRRAATYQQKAKDILDALRRGKIDVENWLGSARQAVEAKLLAPDGPEIISTLPPNPIKHRKAETDGHGDDRSVSGDCSNHSVHSSSHYEGTKLAEDQTGSTEGVCVALYEYNADRPDELSMNAGEEMTVVSTAAGDEWLLVENSLGKQGYVPANYVQRCGRRSSRGSLTTSHAQRSTQVESRGSPENGWQSDGFVPSTWDEADRLSTTNSVSPQWSTQPKIYSQYTYDVTTDVTETTYSSYSHGSGADLYGSVYQEEHSTVVSVATSNKNSTHDAAYCRAIYDYTADDPEDLSFREGDVIRIISRFVTSGVDDGFWKGELHGRVGSFLSSLTEEMADSDSPVSDLGASITSTPSPLPSHVELAPHVPPRRRLPV